MKLPGVLERCVYTVNFNPSKLALHQTTQQLMMQCLGQYPLDSWVVYKQATVARTKTNGIKTTVVDHQWIMRSCSANGWSEPIVDEQGEEVRRLIFIFRVIIVTAF